MRAISSNSFRLMEKSAEFLWAKQAAHLDNITNAETPGYRVKTVTFEEKMSALLAQAAAEKKQPVQKMREAIEESTYTVWDDGEVVRMDDNGVDTTEQMLEAVRTAYQLSYAYRAITSDIGLLRRAISGGAGG